MQLLHGALGWMRGWIWMHRRIRPPGLATGDLGERRVARGAATAYGQLEAAQLGSEIRPVTADALGAALALSNKHGNHVLHVKVAIDTAQAEAAAKAAAVGRQKRQRTLICTAPAAAAGFANRTPCANRRPAVVCLAERAPP